MASPSASRRADSVVAYLITTPFGKEGNSWVPTAAPTLNKLGGATLSDNPKTFYLPLMIRGADTILRRATSEDAANLQMILRDTFESTWRPNITDVAAKEFLQQDRPASYTGKRGLLFWVAEVGGVVVGFVEFEGDFINALHVHSTHGRRGVGRQLMDFAESEIAWAGYQAVRLETDTFNTRSRAFYAARGYSEADRYPDKEWNSHLTSILLMKPLM